MLAPCLGIAAQEEHAEPGEPGEHSMAHPGPWAGGGASLHADLPLQAPCRPGGGVMCHGHCQVARSQASEAVMSGEGSGWAEGQERLPLHLLQAAALSCLPVLSRVPSLPQLGQAGLPASPLAI